MNKIPAAEQKSFAFFVVIFLKEICTKRILIFNLYGKGEVNNLFSYAQPVQGSGQTTKALVKLLIIKWFKQKLLKYLYCGEVLFNWIMNKVQL